MKIIPLLLLSTLPLLAGVQTNVTTGTVITNVPIKISTTIVTNVVSGDNSSGCPTCSFDQFGMQTSHPATWPLSVCYPYKAPTERWTTTNIIARVEVSMKWKDKDLVHVEETLISSVTNRWKLSTEWKNE